MLQRADGNRNAEELKMTFVVGLTIWVRYELAEVKVPLARRVEEMLERRRNRDVC